MNERRHYLKKAAAMGLSFLLAFSTLPTVETTKVVADDSAITVAIDTTATYSPTNIVNGDFQTRPWVKYKVDGSYYSVNWSDAAEVTEQNYTKLSEEWGLGDDFTNLKAVSAVQLNGVDEGWNTTERTLWFGDLFEWVNGKPDAINGTPAGKNWGKYNNSIISADGSNFFVELNAAHAGVLYQDLTTHPGDVIRWNLKHGGRISGMTEDITQAMRVEIGAPEKDTSGNPVAAEANSDDSSVDSKIVASTRAQYTATEVTNPAGKNYGSSGTDSLNGLSIAWNDCENGWQFATGTYIVPENQTITRFAFISETDDDLIHGNLLDDIEFSTLFGNLTVSSDKTDSANPKIVLSGYWGETDAVKKLVFDLGDGTDPDKKILIDMSNLETFTSGGQNFKITIPVSVITEKNSTAISADVYHEDYPSAKIKCNLPAEASAPVDPVITLENWVYDNGTGTHTPSVTAAEGKTLGDAPKTSYVYTYYTNSSLENTYKTTTDKATGSGAATVGAQPVNAGTYWLKVEIPETQNYKAGEASCSFTISKADYKPSIVISGWSTDEPANPPEAKNIPAEIPKDAISFDYYIDEVFSQQTTTYDGSSVNGGIPSEAGDYWVKMTVTSTRNYNSTWAKQSFKIKNLIPLNPTVEIEDWSYGDTANTPTCTGNEGNGDVTYTYFKGPNADEKTNTGDGAASEGGVPSLPGEYCVVISIARTDNYSAYNPKHESGNSSDRFAYKQFTILKANVYPEIALSGWTYVSTDTHTPVVTAKAGKTLGDAAASGYEYTYYTDASLTDDKKTTAANGAAENGGQPVNVGRYWVQVKIPETSNYFSGTASCSFIITQSGYIPNVTINGWTYGDAPNSPVKNNVPSDIPDSKISFSYYLDADCMTATTAENSGAASNGAVPSNAGTYWVQMNVEAYGSFVSNSAKKSFTIEKAPISPSVSMKNWIYGNGSSVEPVVSGTVGDCPADDYQFIYYVNDGSGIDESKKTNPGTADEGKKPVDAGNYVVKIEIPETTNYLAGTATAEFTVSPVDYTIRVGMSDWVYGDEVPVTPSVSDIPTEIAPDVTISYKYYTDEACNILTTKADGAAGEGEKPVEVGTYWVQATVGAYGNYNSAKGKTVFNIEKAPLLINIDNQIIYENYPIPELTYTVTGLVNGDKQDIITGKLKTISDGQVGEYTIENDNIDAGNNYNITFKNGTLTVLKLSQAVPITTPVATPAPKPDTAPANVSENKKKLVPYLQMTKVIQVGNSFSLDITNVSDDASVKYKSSKPKVASVSSDGVIKGLKAGRAKITCTIKQNGQTYKFVIIASVRDGKLSQYSLSESKLQTPDTDNPMLNFYKRINTDTPCQITLMNLEPETVVKYTSEKEAVASVSEDGVITGHKKGHTTVKVHFEQDGQIYDYRLYIKVKKSTSTK